MSDLIRNYSRQPSCVENCGSITSKMYRSAGLTPVCHCGKPFTVHNDRFYQPPPPPAPTCLNVKYVLQARYLDHISKTVLAVACMKCFEKDRMPGDVLCVNEHFSYKELPENDLNEPTPPFDIMPFHQSYFFNQEFQKRHLIGQTYDLYPWSSNVCAFCEESIVEHVTCSCDEVTQELDLAFMEEQELEDFIDVDYINRAHTTPEPTLSYLNDEPLNSVPISIDSPTYALVDLFDQQYDSDDDHQRSLRDEYMRSIGYF